MKVRVPFVDPTHLIRIKLFFIIINVTISIFLDGIYTTQTHDSKHDHKNVYNSMDDVSNITENGSIGYSLIPGLTGGQYTSLCHQNSLAYGDLSSMRMSDVSISHNPLPSQDGVISFTWHIYDVIIT